MTAYSYIIYELPETTHISWNSQTSVEIASLTKIMTCIMVLRVASYTNEDLEQTILIGSLEANITGTKAGLEKG
jgi:D-alanyl-D-alanine carboxypeptidase